MRDGRGAVAPAGLRCRACSICRATEGDDLTERPARGRICRHAARHRRGLAVAGPTGPGRGRPLAVPSRSRRPASFTRALPGADLLVWRKTGVPLVTVGIYVPRIDLDPAEQAGIGALTARAAVRGAAGLDAAGLAFAFEGLGGSLGASATSDWLGFGTTVLVEHLAEAARLLDGVFTEPLPRRRLCRARARDHGGGGGAGGRRHVPVSRSSSRSP